MTLLLLIYEFLKTGLFSVGGGLATLPFLSEMAQTYEWFTQEELSDMIAVSESVPGALGVNVAVFAGFRTYGVLGGFAAAVALVTPSIIIVSIVSKALQRCRNNRTVDDVFVLLRPVSVGLIAGAVLPLITMAVTTATAERIALNPTATGMFAVMTVLVFAGEKRKIHPLVFIAIGAAFGIALGGFT
jgi:chromate transporter